jgi:putative restriction endonuclease
VDVSLELALRHRIMAGLREHLEASGGTITRDELSPFLVDQGLRIRLIDRSRGIWNPSELQATLSVVSSPSGPYDDRDEDGGLFRYSYRRGSMEGDNTKLRRACEMSLPIILLRKLQPGLYLPVFPVYVVGDDQMRREFIFALDEGLRFLPDPFDPTPAQRRYAERIAWRRLHQPEFRVKVLRAYGMRCSVCRLGRRELLDAAHIIADQEERGEPVVPNGLSLCKIHHASYDRNLIGITGDGEVRVTEKVLSEADGPMLQHGLKEMHGHAIALPRRRADRPDRDRLDARYQEFLAAS